jgi:hypothetical protein
VRFTTCTPRFLGFPLRHNSSISSLSSASPHHHQRHYNHPFSSTMLAQETSDVPIDSSSTPPYDVHPFLPSTSLSPSPLSPSSSAPPDSANPTSDTPPPPIAYSLLSRSSDELTNPPKSHIPGVFDKINAGFDPVAIEYDSADNFPPANWLHRRHRDQPAVFRDTFSTSRYWSEAQQTAIKAYFTGWDTDEKHPLRNAKGSVIVSSTRSHPSKQDILTDHYVEYYLDRLHRRVSESKSSGLIIYNVDVRKARGVQPFRYGPAGCDIYQCDAYKASDPHSVEAVVVAGMKNTWTRPHIDRGGDSTWSLLIEGIKHWVFARPESSSAFMSYFNRPVNWKQWSREDRQFFVRHRCLMAIQRPGDIVYVSHGWTHMVKHLTDTLSFNSSVLNGWDVADAIERMDHDAWLPAEFEMFDDVRKFIQEGHERIGMTRADVGQLNATWARKREERQAKKRKIDE